MPFLKVDESREDHQQAMKILADYESKFRNNLPTYQLPNVKIINIFESNLNNFSRELELMISLPICNHERVIEKTLVRILENATLPSLLVIILDACRDRSKEIVMRVLMASNAESQVQSIILVESNGDIFESTCENIAVTLSDSKYFLSMQADIYLSEDNFVLRAAAFLQKYENLSGLSGRATIPKLQTKPSSRIGKLQRIHSPINRLLSSLIGRVTLPYFFSRRYYFGDLSSAPENHMFFFPHQRRTTYIGDLIIRGPILWRTKDIKALGGFNDKKFFLGGDDMDFCTRALGELGQIVGYLPTSSYSEFGYGTTHNPELRHSDTVNEMLKRKVLQSLAESVQSTGVLANHPKKYSFQSKKLRISRKDIKNV